MPILGPLATERINRIRTEIESRELITKGLWLGRLNRVRKTDEEIMAKVTADVIAADIITDDSEAVVRGSEQISFQTNKVAKYKHGRLFSESNLRLLDRIEQNSATATERGIFDNYVVNSLQRLRQGIEDREEMVVCQMLEDNGVYDRLGVKFSGLTWGMPSALKVTTAVEWDVAATATPIADILAVVQASVDRGGPRYNRITLSTQALLYAIATDEFETRVKASLTDTASTNFNPNYLSREDQQRLFGRMLGMEIEIYDGQTKVENLDGSKTNTRFQGANKVVLSFTGNDNNNAVWDFGIGGLIEKVAARLAGKDLGMADGPEGDFGIFSYAMLPNEQLNPPGLVLWSVDRGFPAKYEEEANAVLTVYS